MGFFQQVFNDTHRPAAATSVLAHAYPQSMDSSVSDFIADPSAPEPPLQTAAPQSTGEAAVPPPPESAPIQTHPDVHPSTVAEASPPSSHIEETVEEPTPVGLRRARHSPPPTPAEPLHDLPPPRRTQRRRPGPNPTPTLDSNRPDFSLQPPQPPRSSSDSATIDTLEGSFTHTLSPTVPMTDADQFDAPSQERRRPLSEQVPSPERSQSEPESNATPPPARVNAPTPHEPREAQSRQPSQPTRAHPSPPARFPRPSPSARPPAPRQPTVRIGHIDIVIQAPTAPAKAQPAPTMTHQNAWFLRSL